MRSDRWKPSFDLQKSFEQKIVAPDELVIPRHVVLALPATVSKHAWWPLIVRSCRREIGGDKPVDGRFRMSAIKPCLTLIGHQKRKLEQRSRRHGRSGRIPFNPWNFRIIEIPEGDWIGRRSGDPKSGDVTRRLEQGRIAARSLRKAKLVKLDEL